MEEIVLVIFSMLKLCIGYEFVEVTFNDQCLIMCVDMVPESCITGPYDELISIELSDFILSRM